MTDSSQQNAHPSDRFVSPAERFRNVSGATADMEEIYCIENITTKFESEECELASPQKI